MKLLSIALSSFLPLLGCAGDCLHSDSTPSQYVVLETPNWLELRYAEVFITFGDSSLSVDCRGIDSLPPHPEDMLSSDADVVCGAGQLAAVAPSRPAEIEVETVEELPDGESRRVRASYSLTWTRTPERCGDDGPTHIGSGVPNEGT